MTKKTNDDLSWGFSPLNLIKAKNPDDDDTLLTVQEAAEFRSTTRIAIHDLINRGRLDTVTIGGRKFIWLSDLKDFQYEKFGPKTKPDDINKEKQNEE